ncbi:MAG: FAD-binding oxidoreductase, partial [Calditrichaeota bacterium]|nr:FAD-binding oxidoreductase [Calditrichota bacterium]
MNAKQRKYLEEKFGNRVTFDRIERKLYGHDIAAIPSLVKPLVGNTMPDAVVQPETEEELVGLMKWAIASGIPVTPRGKGSSGYGGAIPIHKGLVVDFYRMKRILNVNSSDNTVTVQAGITWEKLEQALNKKGLALRLYPTSAPASTVAGWLAQGGAGIGSYQYGWFKDNVISAKVVLPTGETRTFSGKDLDVVADSEGITGLITEVTVRIQPLEELKILSLAFPTPFELQDALCQMVETKLPIWSLVFINPRMAEMKNRSPLMEHHGHPAEERVLLPAAYVVTLAFRTRDAEGMMKALSHIAEHHQGEILSDRIAHHEWKHRFKLMVVKRLGPSLVPVEVVVPLHELGKVLTEIERAVNQPIVKEGVIIRDGVDGKPEAVILGFIPSDQRRFAYNFVFGLVLTIMKIAERHGGRPYATGLYFSSKAGAVLGVERADRLRAFKRQIDPRHLMNPGKVISNRFLSTALSLGGTL